MEVRREISVGSTGEGYNRGRKAGDVFYCRVGGKTA